MAVVASTPENCPIVRDLLAEGLWATEIMLIDCPHCGGISGYTGGFTAGCSWCGADIARYSDDAYTLADYWHTDWAHEGLP